MKKLICLLITSVALGCSNESRNSVVNCDYYFTEVELFGYSEELCLSNKNTFEITYVDFHSGTGGVQRGTYKWEDEILIMTYEEKQPKFYLLDSLKLYEIKEFQELKASQDHGGGFEIIKIDSTYNLPFILPARMNWEDWNKGRIENFDELIKKFKSDWQNTFEN